MSSEPLVRLPMSYRDLAEHVMRLDQRIKELAGLVGTVEANQILIVKGLDKLSRDVATLRAVKHELREVKGEFEDFKEDSKVHKLHDLQAKLDAANLALARAAKRSEDGATWVRRQIAGRIISVVVGAALAWLALRIFGR